MIQKPGNLCLIILCLLVLLCISCASIDRYQATLSAPGQNGKYSTLRYTAPNWPDRQINSLGFSTHLLPQSNPISIKNVPKQSGAVARIFIKRNHSLTKKEEAGLDALSFYAASQAYKNEKNETIMLSSLLYNAGAYLELQIDNFDEISLELISPKEELPTILGAILLALHQPLFLDESIVSALQLLKFMEASKSLDIVARTSSEYRSHFYPNHPYGISPWGSQETLESFSKEMVINYWNKSRPWIMIALVWDGDNKYLKDELTKSLSSLPEERKPIVGTPPPPLPFSILSSVSNYYQAWDELKGSSVLRTEFLSPPSSSPDFPPFLICLSMLEEMLQRELRSKTGLTYGVWTRASYALSPSASITLYKTSQPKVALTAVESSVAVLQSGKTYNPLLGKTDSIADSLEFYKTRLIARIKSQSANASHLALAMARDMATGGDGSYFLHLEDQINIVKTPDLDFVISNYFTFKNMAWLIMGDSILLQSGQ